jgi:hypothetical protein
VVNNDSENCALLIARACVTWDRNNENFWRGRRKILNYDRREGEGNK